MNHPLQNLPKDVRGHIYSFLTIPILRHELLHVRHYIRHKTAVQMINLCREMGFLSDLRTMESGEYAHPAKLYFFWIRPHHLRRTYMVARTRSDPFVTSGIAKRCRMCMSFSCIRHQLQDEQVERHLLDVIIRSKIHITAHRDIFTNRQYMDVVL